MSIIVVAGTFDPFHIGHEALLNAAFAHKKSDIVMVGIMADAYVRNFKKRSPTPYAFRAEVIRNYCNKICKGKPFTIECIQDDIGKMADERIKYVVLSTEKDYTSWLEAVNDMRRASVIPVFVPVVTNKNGRRISSTDIRVGRINRNGD